jgi:hypothetical protein
LRRSTIPLDSGSFGGSSTILVANVPANTATGSVGLPRPMPGSLSQINRRGTRPSWVSNSHDPSRRSGVLRVGIIRPSMNRECAAVITSTGSIVREPSSSKILRGGNHRSHCATSPADHDNRSAGSIGRCSARTRLTLSRNHRIEGRDLVGAAEVCTGTVTDVVHAVRVSGAGVAGRDAGHAGNGAGRAGRVDRVTTVVLEIPNFRAMLAFGTPSADSLLINAQSSTVITLQSSRVFTFRAPLLSSFQPPPTAGATADSRQ